MKLSYTPYLKEYLSSHYNINTLVHLGGTGTTRDQLIWYEDNSLPSLSVLRFYHNFIDIQMQYTFWKSSTRQRSQSNTVENSWDKNVSFQAQSKYHTALSFPGLPLNKVSWSRWVTGIPLTICRCSLARL